MIGTTISQFLTRNETTLPSSFLKRTDLNTSQPIGYNGTAPTDNPTLFLLQAEGTNYTSGKIGFQFGSYPNYSFGGIYGKQIAYDNNTIGQISFDIRILNSDTSLTEAFLINSACNGVFNYDLSVSRNLNVSGVFQSPITS